MPKRATWNPAAMFVVVYAALVLLFGIALVAALFIATDMAFRGSREVEIPYLMIIRGDVDPPYWDLHLYGIAIFVIAIPLALAALIVTVAAVLRNRNRR
jgi:hypothetical protein